jgi:adenylate cyclase
MADVLSPNTVMFADITDSTGLYERFGDKQASAHIQDALSQARVIVLQARGIVIKTIGDELMCCFAAAGDAVRAAREIQTRFDKAVGALPRLSFRIGVHSGDAIWIENDLFGDAVNVAARLAAMAKAEQILSSRDTLTQCPEPLGAGARELGLVSVKGRRQPVDCMEVLWRNAVELTSVMPRPDGETPAARLNLTFGADSFVVDVSNPQLSLGRHADNDIVATSPLISGSHAIIEHRSNKFVLRDHSTNGCLVIVAGRTPLRVHREEMALFEEGTIILGGAPAEADRSVQFRIVS